jgi:hypothetical protein
MILFSLYSLGDNRSMAVNGSHRARSLAARCSLFAARAHLSDVVAVSNQHHGRHENFPAISWSRAEGLSNQVTGSLKLISGSKGGIEPCQF